MEGKTDKRDIIEVLHEFESNVISKYGNEFMILLNLRAINDMLIKNGKGERLYSNMVEILERFENKGMG